MRLVRLKCVINNKSIIFYLVNIFFLMFFMIFWNRVFLNVWFGDVKLIFEFLKILCFMCEVMFLFELCLGELSFIVMLFFFRNELNFFINLFIVSWLFWLMLSLLKMKLSCLKFRFKLLVIFFKFVFVMYFLFLGLYKKNSFWLGLLIDEIFVSFLLFLFLECILRKSLNFVVNFFKVK